MVSKCDHNQIVRPKLHHYTEREASHQQPFEAAAARFARQRHQGDDFRLETVKGLFNCPLESFAQAGPTSAVVSRRFRCLLGSSFKNSNSTGQDAGAGGLQCGR